VPAAWQLPRTRGLSDVVFYRPDKAIRYRNIDMLFGGETDWDLIATHARDMFQVALSIFQAGLVLQSMLLRKLGTHSRRNLLYRAFREPGRVERTRSCCASCPVSISGALSVPKQPKSSRSTNSLVGSPSAARS
jgi:TnpA family transposase